LIIDGRIAQREIVNELDWLIDKAQTKNWLAWSVKTRNEVDE
jgi:hypothetical protein